jgi:signal recognition particle GTPase
MAEKTLLIETDKAKFDPAFLEILNNLAKQYGVRVKSDSENSDSVQIVREGRDWLDQRDAERAARSKGLRSDLSHLDRMRR